MTGSYAFVTLVSSDAYLPGALAQAAALRDLHPSPPAFPEVIFQIVCLVTPETVDVTTIKLLRRAFDLVIGVEVLEQENNKNLQLLGRPDLTTVLTKLHVFRLTQYSKIVFLDADVLPIRPLSHLFNIPHEFAAAPDVGWPDIFNSGVLVLSPGVDKFNDLNVLLESKGSWDGGDQGLLNEWRAGDWHRLSFTYNTTPTAAYTYAPAYERYGSQINAIHFIGPNKPWNAIPFRSPFLAEKRATPSKKDSGTSQQAYDYDSLVDRWFAVYDKHYRSQPIAPPSFELRRYASAWHPTGSDIPSGEVTPSKPFTLEDLRKIAIEGMTGAGFGNSSSAGQAGEGEYRSLPLEGRFDLMRPRKPPPVESDDDSPSAPGATLSPEPKMEIDYFSPERDLPMTPIARQLGLPEDPDLVRWRTLPTPGPNEVPPSPKIHPRSLPGTPTPTSDYYASSAGPTSDSEGWGSSDKTTGRIAPFPSHLFQQTPPPNRPPPQSTSQGEHSSSHHHHYHHHHNHQNSHGHHEHQNSQNNPTGESERHHQAQSHHGSSGHQPHGRAPRPPSPPLVTWNPAMEPPPNDTPRSSFPADTYFTNAWDSNYRQERSAPQKGAPGYSSVFFQAPPPSQIPETLLEQGHYRNVTGEGSSGSVASPNPSKVKSIFPWEDKPRQLPGRVFPELDAPSPMRFVKPTKPTKPRTSPTSLTPPTLLTPPTPPTPTPQAPDKRRAEKHVTPSPIPRLPTSLRFANAWDGDPSIQNYASRLVRPPPAPHSASTFDGDPRSGGRGQSWDEKSEANSQDGDDEDEGDEDEDTRDNDSDDDRKSRPRTRTPSIAEDTRQVQKSAQKTYQSQGVQTISRKKRSQSVQVSILVEAPPSQAASRRSSVSSKRSLATGSGSSTFQSWDVNHAPRPIRSRSTSNGSFGHSSSPAPRPQRGLTKSPISQPQLPTAKSFPPHVPEPPRIPTPPGVATPRVVSPPTKVVPPPKVPIPPTRPSVQTNRNALNPAKAPSISNRQISNDSSIGSPPSSVGPASPPDDQPGFTVSPTGTVRKGTRVWDPARGVELFKRGSEEVLARFLKMDSWENGR